jgi:hypothetical protein
MSTPAHKVYTAPPTLAALHASDAPMRFVRGPVGSGKSVAMVMEMVRRAQETPRSPDGVARSRAVVVRNTLSQLKTTSLVTIQEWLRPITHYKVSDSTVQLRFMAKGGYPVECDILLLPLDTAENVQRLLSLELTFAWVSEFRELPLDIVQAVFSRCGRYPSRSNVPDGYWYGLFGESNSFAEDTPWYEFLELDKPKNVEYFIQPGAMEPAAENRDNLPGRYYEDLIESNSEAWVDQYVHNKLGPSLSGQAVFAKSFIHDFHTAKNLIPDINRPIVIGLDTGRNPAAVTGQLDARGRALIFSALYAENVGMEIFLHQHLRPHLSRRFNGGKFWISVDPAARQRSQIGEESVFEAIKRLGFSVLLAPTNQITPRLRSVERYMSQQVAGGAGFLVDRVHAAELVRALMHDYRYKRDKKGTLNEIPEKLHPASDVADALQYLCMSVGSNAIARSLKGPAQTNAPPSAIGWT